MLTAIRQPSRLANRPALPAREVEIADQRNELALLASLDLVESHEGGLGLTKGGAEVLRRADRVC